jgi:hypothetical protein
MAKARQREPWEQKAEDLTRSVRHLIENHGRDIDCALRQSMSEDEARGSVKQILRLVEALELELLRADSNRARGQAIVVAIKSGLGTVAGSVVLTAATLGVTQAYNAVLDTEDKADEVIECVIQQDDFERELRRQIAEKKNQAPTLEEIRQERDRMEAAERDRREAGQRLGSGRLGSGRLSTDDPMDIGPLVRDEPLQVPAPWEADGGRDASPVEEPTNRAPEPSPTDDLDDLLEQMANAEPPPQKRRGAIDVVRRAWDRRGTRPRG